MVTKQAKLNNTSEDLLHTGTIGAIGLGTSYLTSKITNTGGNHGKAALIGGALGLAGDYAAVKLNKHLSNSMNKMASDKNVYLEKIAEMYSIKGNTTNGYFPTPNVQLDRDQYHKYFNDTSSSSAPGRGLLIGGALGAGAGAIFSRPGNRVINALMFGTGAASIGGALGANIAHNKALTNLGIVNPVFLEDEDED